MSSQDLFKWTPITQDLKKGKRKMPKSKSNTDVERWLSGSAAAVATPPYITDTPVASDEPPLTQTFDDIDLWVQKIKKAADLAKSDVEVCHTREEEAAVFQDYGEGSAVDDVSSLFSRMVSGYLPDYSTAPELGELEKEEAPHHTDLGLDDRHDAVTEARGLLSAWLQTKGELDQEELLATHRPSPWESLTPRERTEAEEMEIALKHLRSIPVEKRVQSKVKQKRKKPKNPALSIAARQEQARERRRLLEEERVGKLREAAERKAARAEADRAIALEKARRAHEQAEEEGRIKEEMAALRLQLREEQKAKIASYEREREEQMEAHRAALAVEYRAVVRETAEEEGKRRALLSTRHALLRQLEEAEKRELRERYNMLQLAFTRWRESTLDSRVHHGKAVAFYQWKTQLRAWRGWRRYHKGRREKKEERIREAVFREHKNIRMADIHYQRCNLRVVFTAWRTWACTQRDERREREEGEARRRLMERCLVAVVSEQQQQQSSKPAKLGINFAARKAKREQEIREGITAEVEFSQKAPLHQPPEPFPVKQPAEQPTEQSAKQPAEQTSENPRKDARVPQAAPFNPWDVGSGDPAILPRQKTERPVPAALRGMEERARQRKARHQQIEERKLERKRAEERRRMEEERRKAEEEAERKAAERERKLKEAEELREQQRRREEELREMKRKTLLALSHYHQHIMKNRVLRPLRKLVARVREDTSRAVQHHDTRSLSRHLGLWREALQIRELEKEERAERFYKRYLLRSTFRTLRKATSLQETFTRLADRHWRRVSRKRALIAWREAAVAEKKRGQDLEKRAREMYLRNTKAHHLRGWRRVTPLLRREREAEERKNRMRSMVADLLPDFADPSAD